MFCNVFHEHGSQIGIHSTMGFFIVVCFGCLLEVNKTIIKLMNWACTRFPAIIDKVRDGIKKDTSSSK